MEWSFGVLGKQSGGALLVIGRLSRLSPFILTRFGFLINDIVMRQESVELQHFDAVEASFYLIREQPLSRTILECVL
jgi:hypothetical protein